MEGALPASSKDSTMQTITLSGSALTGVAPELSLFELKESLPATVCLGRVRPKAMPQALRLGAYLKRSGLETTLPPLPVDWTSKAMAALSRMYLNDQLGTCTIADAFKSVGVWTGNESGAPVQGSDAEVLATYRIWNPGNQDNGCVITNVLDYARDHGITIGGVAHKIDGYVAVDWTNWDEVLVALFLFGAIRLGINLPQAWTSAAVWDVTNSPIVGGHDVPCVAMLAADRIRIASWGRLYDITRAAFTSRRWLEEAWAVLSPDWYAKASVAPNLIALDDLRSDLAKLAQGTIPDIGPTPVPTPTPTPTPVPTPVPSPTPLFSVTANRDIRQGESILLPVKKPMPKGVYDIVPHPAHALAFSWMDIPWSQVLAVVGGLIDEYGPYAAVKIDAYIETLNWPAPAKAILERVVDGLLGRSAVV